MWAKLEQYVWNVWGFFLWTEVFVVSALGGKVPGLSWGMKSIHISSKLSWRLRVERTQLTNASVWRTCELFQWRMCHMCIPSNTVPTGFHDLAPISSEFHNSWQHSQCSYRCRRYSLRSLKKIFEVNEEFDHDTLVLWVWLCRKHNRKHGKVCLKESHQI